jgi:hypothetical protein
MAGLLVSVRSVREAETALAAGADWIDVKEPAHGPLGRASDATILEVQACVAGRTPVSAALGEWRDGVVLPGEFNGFVKIGLAGCAHEGRWRSPTAGINPAARLVLAAYADWKQAEAPRLTEVLDAAIAQHLPALLIDTFQKHGRSLLDWCSLAELQELGSVCRANGMLFALAGSLREAEIERVLPLQPDLIAVRGAACRDADRADEIDAAAVSRLAKLVHGCAKKLTSRTMGTPAATSGNHSSTTPAEASACQSAS